MTQLPAGAAIPTSSPRLLYPTLVPTLRSPATASTPLQLPGAATAPLSLPAEATINTPMAVKVLTTFW